MKQLINKVLLIDDDMDTNILNEFVISDTGIVQDIVIFQEAKAALNYLKTPDNTGNYPSPDIIMLDINMPVMNGWEFLEEYKQLPIEQRTGIIITMLSSSMNPEDRSKAEKMEIIHGFINKPLTEDKFRDLVNKFFNK